MQWVAFYVRQNAYFPRTPGEKSRLTVLATNIEANTRQQAVLQALKIAWHKLNKWVLIDVVPYDPEVHDNIIGYEMELGELLEGKTYG